MSNNWQKQLDTAVSAAKSGADVLKRYWGKLSKVETKSYTWDLVTIADKESEAEVMGYLKQAFPSYGILAEESGGDHPSHVEYLWVIDPLDGTTNYTHQYPMVAVSISLMHKGETVVGVTYNPIIGELFTATKGGGAYLNGEKISVSKVQSLGAALLSTGFPYDRLVNIDNNYTEFSRLTDRSQGVRRGGSACMDLAYVAAGRLDGYWERGCKVWDNAAGVLMVEEAGGKVTGYDLSPVDMFGGRLLATNGLLHETISSVLLTP